MTTVDADGTFVTVLMVVADASLGALEETMLPELPQGLRSGPQSRVTGRPTSPEHVCASLWEVQPSRERTLLEAPLFVTVDNHRCACPAESPVAHVHGALVEA